VASVTVPELPPVRVDLALPASPLYAGASVPLSVSATTRLGDPVDPAATFSSSDDRVATVDPTGRVFGVAPGRTTVTATVGGVAGRLVVDVRANPAVAYRVVPEKVSARTGDVIRLRLEGLDRRGAPVTGFLPSWSVGGPAGTVEAEGAEGVFVAERPGAYRVTAEVGRQNSASAIIRVSQREVPGRLVLVGRGPAADHHSGDTWVFQGVDGRDYAYIGTFAYDWLKVWDVTEPGAPVLTDSVQLDARRINDVKIHPNNRLAIVTREGASNRRNGIVLLDLAAPAHPTILSEFTETVTGGVHNTWVDGDHNLVYAVNDGTRDIHIIDIADPRHPAEVGRWGLNRQSKSLHDVIVQDGYAYLSYWHDGVVMLDVGAGTHGGTPTAPVLVSQFQYPVPSNTHTAWRNGRYLFVGDEVYPSDWSGNATRRIDARGYVHVIDYADPEHPKEVARYEVPEAGAHNIWVEDDVLYVGYYQAGLRAVDISGELRGDLYAQGREIATILTTDEQTTVPNWPMTWGAQLHKGNIYTSDLNSGLWIAKLERPERPVP